VRLRLFRILTQQAVTDDQQIEEAWRRRFTDARRLGPEHGRGMSPELLSQQIPEDSLAYADSLYSYASPRLDELSLRCWVIQRLMLDDGLDHASAERAFELAHDVARTASAPCATPGRHRHARVHGFAIGWHATRLR